MQASITRDDEERIWQWNANLPVAPENCIHDVFDEQLQSSRDTAAIDSWDGHFTYAELDELSTRLALHLRSRGAGTDAVIPICFEKSRWVVVCMLAVVKSGAAFATLDPAMPTERLASFVRSVQPRVMLVGAGLKDRFDGLGLDLVSNAPELCEAGPPGDATLPQVRPDDLAYVLFTSGSTGTPKVVLHCHRAAAANMRHATGYGPGSRVLQFASQAFGASIWEIFKTLGNGGCLVIPPARDRLGGIANFITKKQITRTFFTPSLLNLLKPEEVTCLQILTVGGEPVTEQLIQTWAHRVRLLEAFGMTEGVAIETKIDREGKKSREGQTLVGATWIVDADDPDKLAPIGVAGELLIESPTLCKGYLDNPEADASAFLEQPLWARKHGSGRAARLFRTGDLARYTEDGVVQIVGRKDTRVKLYGQRFELGEVEQVMAKSLPDGVSAAAELIIPSGGSPMLVAFIHGSTVDFVSVIKDIREKMAAALPDYMVPRGFVKLAERPMNASGKLDRKKLREMASALTTAELVAHGSDAVKTQPETDMEKKMQSLWSEVLNLPAPLIGREDDFFFNGGSSLQCIKLISSARRENISIDIEDIFRGRTLQAISAAAHVIRQEERNPDQSAGSSRYQISDITTTVPESDVEEVLEATDWQAWSIYAGLLKSRGWHDYMIFHFTGSLDVSRLQKACHELVATHSVLRTTFLVHEQATFQVVLTPKAYSVEFTTHEVQPGESLAAASQEVIDTDVKRKTRLGDALVKFMLINDSSASAYRLVMRISHAQYDAVSVGEIWRALESAYWGDEIPQLSPFSHYVDKAAAATAASKADEFWKARMAGAPISDIISHSRPPYSRIVDSAAAASVPVPDLRAQGLTTATAVLACWSIVLSQLCQQQEVVFGNIISGRHLNVQGVEQTIGPCMNTLPIRAKVDPQATFAELLQTIQDDYLQSLPFSHLGHRQLIQNSTSWPRWSRFSTIVNHISLDAATAAAPPFSSARALAAGLRCALDIHEPPHDKADLWLHSASAPGGDAVSLELRYSGRAFPRAWVEAVLAHFCAVFERLPAVLGCAVGSACPAFAGPGPAAVVLGGAVAGDVGSETQAGQRAVAVSGALGCVVRGAWAAVLGKGFETRVDGFSEATPFYDVWGDLIGAAALARCYGDCGYEVSTEDVLDNPSQGEQMALLAGL
ncbi:uncharacterized protein SETTUDRAFT_155102 [Neofusicoccum parvum]|nr:uncharacterized protein SETTUDRAFT_155102 [Neofusicoccum parvum]